MAMDLRSPLKKARGLGSAKEGVHHWWLQRVTSIALVPLTLWFVLSLAALAGSDYAAVVEWVRSPLVALLLVLTVATAFYHAALGVQVVVEDYVSHHGWRMAIILAEKFLFLLLGVAAILSVLRVSFGA